MQLPTFFRGRRAPLLWGGALLLVACVIAALLIKGRDRSQPTIASYEQEQPGDEEDSEPGAISTKIVKAAWYDVPAFSLAKRRAGIEELTAAHNKLPIGTRVRVTDIKNGKSVIVRITDRGIHDRKVKLDLCKEAAEQLGMVSAGIVRVRMEVLADPHEPTAAPSAVVAAQH